MSYLHKERLLAAIKIPCVFAFGVVCVLKHNLNGMALGEESTEKDSPTKNQVLPSGERYSTTILIYLDQHR